MKSVWDCLSYLFCCCRKRSVAERVRADACLVKKFLRSTSGDRVVLEDDGIQPEAYGVKVDHYADGVCDISFEGGYLFRWEGSEEFGVRNSSNVSNNGAVELAGFSQEM